MNSRDCKHGQLKRVCNICELEEEIKEMQSGNNAQNNPVSMPDWVDMCQQLSEIEEQINSLKRQVMRSAGQIKGV